MDSLFPGEPQSLPKQAGSTWFVTADSRSKPPEVRHAEGYEQFVQLAAEFGTPPRDLFNLWRFAHFIRAHAAAFEADPGLQHSAVVFLGNALASQHNLVWRHHPRGLVVETTEPSVLWVGDEATNNPSHRSAGVERMVEALLEADEERFSEFHPTAEMWQTPQGT